MYSNNKEVNGKKVESIGDKDIPGGTG